MDKLLLKEIVIEQKKSLETLDLGLRRERIDLIEKYLSIPHAVIISGIRRAGKSTLLAQIVHYFYNQEGGYYFNFEDERLINFGVNDFNDLYEIFLELFGEKKVFFLDEIQNVANWELFVRRMQDKGYKFFITGSNASLLSRELGTRLTGRCIMIELYPFSFKEFLGFKNYAPQKDSLFLTTERGLIKKYFQEYLRGGGLAEYLKYQEKIILKRIYEDILYRDIVARYEIKEIKALRELGLYLLSNLGGLFSYNKLKQILHLGSVNTVKSYISYLEESILIFTVNRFSYSLKQQFINNKKVYCIDNGIAEAVSFQFSKNKGRFLENLVFIELKREEDDIYYYKTSNNLEVDFLVKRDKEITMLIQVSGGLYDQKVREREVNALQKAMEELKIKKAYILTEDEEEEIKISHGIIIVEPIYKWLLR